MAEIMLRPGGAQIVANRYASPEAKQTAEKFMRGVMKDWERSVRSEMKSRVNVDMTNDKMAVAAAVRGSGRTPPAPEPPNLGRMSNAQFNEYVSSVGLNKAQV